MIADSGYFYFFTQAIWANKPGVALALMRRDVAIALKAVLLFLAFNNWKVTLWNPGTFFTVNVVSYYAPKSIWSGRR
ncbi:hypothetical protein [Mixta hanseatica]|uniref:Uncharacterized protein n=1 Tax=Mixta hanseatica TaxID=2872648 RepID=A0ABY4RDN9_9GAMM|nr:hypothetical protein [Mixta hanseatica]UQY46244.1 hypothetical protein K6958_18940 [Mixta hanseatica]